MNILVLNAGSSSVKYQVFGMETGKVLVRGLVDRISEPGSEVASHREALQRVMTHLQFAGILDKGRGLHAIGHRVVHGGERFCEPVRVDEDVLAAIRDMIPLAPLHNPANLHGIEVARQLFPDLPQVAVFDTAFHQTMPAVAFHYAVPDYLYREYRVRRYGFHGTSHQYVAQQAASYLHTPLADLNLITLHLGNGCSATAIAGGKSVDTSMGMTPLEGLVMGTRCGDLDPALHFYLERHLGLDSEALEKLLNKHSGLHGICGVGDMREVQTRAAAGDEKAQLAQALFAYRVKKYVGAYYAVLGRVDAIVFTGGIGEHASGLRAQVCEGLERLGISIHPERNAEPVAGIAEIGDTRAAVRLLVVPTNEELAIARSTAALLGQS